MDPNKINQWADEIIERANFIKKEVIVPDYLLVKTGAELQAALNNGGLIKLSDTGSFVGNFVVNHDNTTVLGTPISHPGRVLVDEVKSVLEPGDKSVPVLRVLANGFRISGVRPIQGLNDRTVVSIGSATEPDVTKQPKDVVFDQMLIESIAGIGKRGIECHSRGYSLLNSLVLGFMYQGADSQAFWSCNGPGPYLLDNNQLEGSGENIMFGGADVQSEAHMPRNITIRNNWVYKPQDWRNFPGSVKNSIEFKAATNVLVENNLFDGNWKDSQAGHMLVFTPRNPSGNDNYIQVADISFKNNRTIHHTDGYAISILLADSPRITQNTARLTFEHNLFQDSKHGIQILGGVVEYLKVNNNTWPVITDSLILTEVKTKYPLEFKRNVFLSGIYGVFASGSGVSYGKPSIDWSFDPYTFTENVIEKTRTIPWPDGNTIVPLGTLATSLDVNYKYIPDPTLGW